MNKSDMLSRIEELEKEISLLPSGSITKKKMDGKVYYYHRISYEGKRKEKYIPLEKLNDLYQQIQKRKELEIELKDLKNNSITKQKQEKNVNLKFKTFVRIGEQLIKMASLSKDYRRRECYDTLSDFVFGKPQDKVFILYGLRRTGKTTLMRQVILNMTDEQLSKTAFMQITQGNTLSQVYSDLKILEDYGYKYIFIDEVTMLEDFIEGAAVFSDIYAASGMKIVLSGTDSLGFAFTSKNQLYDRCIMLHTTFIPYREFERVLGIKGIDEYIRYGGTMSLGGFNYNDSSPFSTKEKADDYIDSAIARNIQHSLKYYQDGGHFHQLYDLYAKDELTSAINRVVENLNHRFTKDVLTQAFKSSDLSITSRNMMSDRKKPLNLEENIDRSFVEKTLKTMFDILEKDEQTVEIDDVHANQIKEYFSILDLISDIDLIHLPREKEVTKKTILTQPGMRYAFAQALVNSLLMDQKFGDLDIIDRNRVLERVLDTVKGFIMEEIVLLETKIAQPKMKVFQVQFAIGEFDMVVQNESVPSCTIYEIKHSKEIVSDQYRHLIDEEKCQLTERAFGKIIDKCVIYRGPSSQVEGIKYLNVEEYLKGLAK